MTNKKQLVGRWVTWKGLNRVEQELHEDGRFEGMIIDEDDSISAVAVGNWNLVGDSIHWHYEKGDGVRIPRDIDVNKIVHCDRQRFTVVERDGTRTDFYRGIKGCLETSSNFDLKDVGPLLKRISTHIESGFGTVQIASVMKDLKKLKREQTRQFVFPIICERAAALFGIRVLMDDIDAPDIYFYAPLNLVQQIDKELEEFDA